MLHAGTQLGQHVVRHVGRRLGDEEDADALGADQPDGLGDRVQERLGRAVEQQVRLVEEEDQLGNVDVADLGQVVEEVGQHPHQEGREDRGTVLQVRQLQQRDDALAVRGGADQVAGVELGLSEELVSALGLQGHKSAQDDANRGRRQPAELLQLELALVAGQVEQHFLEVGQVEQRQALGVGVVEDQPEAGLLGLVEAQHLAQQDRAERADGGAQRHTGALAAEGVELGGATGRLPVLANLGGAREQLLAGGAGDRDPGQVALDVRREDRDAGARDRLSQQLQGAGLAGTGCPRNEAVPVQHRQRQPDPDVGVGRPVHHQHAQVDGRCGERVAGLDLLDGLGLRSHAPKTGTKPCFRRPTHRLVRTTEGQDPLWF